MLSMQDSSYQSRSPLKPLLLNASSLYFRLVFSAILMSMSIAVVVVLTIKTVLMSSVHSLRGDQQ